MIGLIANPASGKDVRRLVARGIGVPDHEKINLLGRVLAGALALRAGPFQWMPTAADLVERSAELLELPAGSGALAMPVDGTPDDTTAAAARLAELGAACIVVLGGDGTARAAAKGAGDTPLLPLSTGTNNVFPQSIEPTLAGLAAAIVARGAAEAAIARAPCLRIVREGNVVDLALIDVAVYDGMIGARAIWLLERVRQLISTRTTPDLIGLASIAGYLGAEQPAQAAALALRLGSGGHDVLAPIAPGVVERVSITERRWLCHGDAERISAPCVLALDGERELPVRPGMLVDVRFDSRGPLVVDARRALELGVAAGLFRESRGSGIEA